MIDSEGSILTSVTLVASKLLSLPNLSRASSNGEVLGAAIFLPTRSAGLFSLSPGRRTRPCDPEYSHSAHIDFTWALRPRRIITACTPSPARLIADAASIG